MPKRRNPGRLSPGRPPSSAGIWLKLAAFALFAFALLGLAGILLLAPDFLNGRMSGALLAEADFSPKLSPSVLQVSATPQVKTPSTSPLPSETLPPPTPGRVMQAGCIGWEQVSMADSGEQICVQGEFQGEYQREDGCRVLTFSDQPGSFQVWSLKRPFNYYLGDSTSGCVIVRGWVMTSGVRPFIALGKDGKMEPCP